MKFERRTEVSRGSRGHVRFARAAAAGGRGGFCALHGFAGPRTQAARRAVAGLAFINLIINAL